MKIQHILMPALLGLVLACTMSGCYMNHDGKEANDIMAWGAMLIGFIAMTIGGDAKSGIAVLGGALIFLWG